MPLGHLFPFLAGCGLIKRAGLVHHHAIDVAGALGADGQSLDIVQYRCDIALMRWPISAAATGKRAQIFAVLQCDPAKLWCRLLFAVAAENMLV